MMLFFLMSAASGLVLYWTTSNLLTVAQQGVYRGLRMLGLFGPEDSSSA